MWQPKQRRRESRLVLVLLPREISIAFIHALPPSPHSLTPRHSGTEAQLRKIHHSLRPPPSRTSFKLFVGISDPPLNREAAAAVGRRGGGHIDARPPILFFILIFAIWTLLMAFIKQKSDISAIFLPIYFLFGFTLTNRILALSSLKYWHYYYY